MPNLFSFQNKTVEAEAKRPVGTVTRHPFLTQKRSVSPTTQSWGGQAGKVPGPPLLAWSRRPPAPRQQLFRMHLSRETLRGIGHHSRNTGSPSERLRAQLAPLLLNPGEVALLQSVGAEAETAGTQPRGTVQSGGRASGAFSWTSSYCGGGVKGSMEGGGTFLSGRLILKSLR